MRETQAQRNFAGAQGKLRWGCICGPARPAVFAQQQHGDAASSVALVEPVPATKAAPGFGEAVEDMVGAGQKGGEVVGVVVEPSGMPRGQGAEGLGAVQVVPHPGAQAIEQPRRGYKVTDAAVGRVVVHSHHARKAQHGKERDQRAGAPWHAPLQQRQRGARCAPQLPLVVLHHQPPGRMRLQRAAEDLVDEAFVPVQSQDAVAVRLHGLGIGVLGSGVECFEGLLQVHGACT